MAERDRLRTLEVRIARHDGLRLGLREREADERERVDPLARLGTRVEDVQPERRDNLVVARAAGVDLAADVAEQPLDRGVDVLVGLEVPVRVVRDLGEPPLDLVELLGGQEPGLEQPLRVLTRRLAVVREQRGVVRAQELPHVRVEARLDPRLPSGHAWILARTRAACNSVSSEEILMKPSAASCGKVSPVPYEASSVE